MPAGFRVRLRPLFVLLAAMALGIFAASQLPFSVPLWSLLIVMALLLGASQALARYHPAGNALCLLTAFFVFGIVRSDQSAQIRRDDISHLIGGPSVWVRGTVASATEIRHARFGGGPSYSFTVKVQEVNDYRHSQAASGWLRVAAFSCPSPPQPGDLLWLRGTIELPPPATNPDSFDYRAHLKRQGIYATLAARREGDIRRIGRVPLPPVMQVAAVIRGAVEKRVQSHLPPEDAALLLGMLLSERGQLPIDLVDAFTRTGTVHILSVSGMHVAVIATLLLWLFRAVTLPKKLGHLLCIAAVWLYALAASGGGGNPPAFRAALCATIFLAAPLLRRNPEPRHTLAFAALILLVLDPRTLFDPGAQLSFATVGTILLWNPVLERCLFPWEPGLPWLARISRGIVAAVSLGVVAHLGSWPLAAFYFHQYSVVSPLANLPISFFADALVVCGLLFSAAPFLPWWLISQGLSLLRESALLFAAPPWAAFSISAPPAFLIFAYYALAGGLAAIVRPSVLAPRPLFTPSASPSMDTGSGSDISPPASRSVTVAATGTADRK